MSEETRAAEGLGTGAGAQAPAAADVPQHGSGFSQLDKIRDKAAKGPRNTTKDIDIPGYDGNLAARYKVLPFERARELELRAVNDASDYRELRVMMGELVEACECILVRGDDGQMEPLMDGGGRLVRFDSRLAKGFDLDAEGAHDVVLDVFAHPTSIGRDRAPYMVAQHFQTYLDWITSARGGAPGE